MIEVLYFEGCPNREAAVDLARDVARELGIAAEIREIEVPRTAVLRSRKAGTEE